MLLKQYDLGCLAHASYLMADEASGIAAVVDPQRNIDQYLQDAAQLGLDIRYVFLTHFHADFLAGHLELPECVAATVCLGARAQADVWDDVVKRVLSTQLANGPGSPVSLR